MIETERDYVRSLDYVIVNYIPELQREDIPQALRGHRNTVFGNVEKIYEFHRHHFLEELEECENNPLQVGQIFLKYDKRFYLYALYNKNKPKSDSLMSEYGSAFFKASFVMIYFCENLNNVATGVATLLNVLLCSSSVNGLFLVKFIGVTVKLNCCS